MVRLLLVLVLISNSTIQNQNTSDSLKFSTDKKYVNEIDKTSYKNLYELSQSYNDKILNTIYWAIGGIFAAIIGIIGSNIYFNYRFNKKEIEAIIQQYDSKIDRVRSDNQELINEKFNEFEKEKSKKISKTQSENLERFKSSLSLVQETLNEKHKTLENRVENNQEYLKNQLESMKASNKNILSSIDNKITELDARIWKNSGKYASALTRFIVVAKRKLDKGEYIYLTISNIADVIKEANYIFSDDKKELNKLIEQLRESESEDKDFQKLLDDIEERIKDIDVINVNP